MKRISFFLMAALMGAPAFLHAQDAATDERLNKLSAQIEDLIAAKDAQNKRIEELAKDLRDLQEQLNKPNASYATSDDVKHLADKLKEIDDKRVQDNEHIVKEIEKLGQSLGGGGSPRIGRSKPVVDVPAADGTNGSPVSGKGYEYSVKDGDTLSIIAAAYREKNIKVTVDQILKANPGLDPKRMHVGQKIFIPAPQ